MGLQTEIEKHMNDQDEFQTDKYAEWCPPDFLALKLTDPLAQVFIWAYAQLRRAKDAGFTGAIEKRLADLGFDPYAQRVILADGMVASYAVATKPTLDALTEMADLVANGKDADAVKVCYRGSEMSLKESKQLVADMRGKHDAEEHEEAARNTDGLS